jgi:hypothetical protein
MNFELQFLTIGISIAAMAIVPSMVNSALAHHNLVAQQIV